MMQQQQQRLKQQQIMNMMQYHPAAYLAAPQIEPILSGNLPPGFDPSTCRSVYVGNIHPSVTEPLLQQVFSSTGPIEGCKLIRKEKSSYGFVDYFDRRCAAHAILTLNGRPLFGQPIKVNWAYASSQREDTSGHYNIFVGDLSPEITDATLYACFSSYPTCSDARVMWDQKTGRSRGFGFVSFRSQQDAQSAINDLNGKWLGSRQIRCNWATKGALSSEDKQGSDAKSVVELTSGSADDGQDKKSDDAPENNPQYTTVYVGNLAPEVTSVDLHRHFHTFGAGIIEDCSWGSKPTPPGTSSTPLPPPAAAGGQIPGYSAAELMNYERQMAMSKMGSMQALMQQHVQSQHALRQAAVMGMGGGGGAVGSSQAVYDGSGFPGVATSSQQQFMYYQ
ncbi:Oligouridylate-binding protein 1 [Linum perenne]